MKSCNPNIIVEFADAEFAKSISQVPQILEDGKMVDPYCIWGLSDDNKLYLKCLVSGTCFRNWYLAENIHLRGLDWNQLQKIVDNLRLKLKKY